MIKVAVQQIRCTFKLLLQLYSDAFFSYSTARSAKYLRTRGKVYLYYFTFDGTFKDPSVLHYGHLLNTSCKSDYLFMLLNMFIKSILVSIPYLFSHIT